jgi:hypothetical protein
MTVPAFSIQQKFAEQRTSILDSFLDEQQLADQLGVKRSTLARWRRLAIGPPFVRKGKAPLYDRESAEQWLRNGGTEAGRRRRRNPP